MPNELQAFDQRAKPLRAFSLGVTIFIASRTISYLIGLCGLPIGLLRTVISIVLFSLISVICLSRVQYSSSLWPFFGGHSVKAVFVSIASCSAALFLSLGWPHGSLWGVALVVLFSAMNKELGTQCAIWGIAASVTAGMGLI